MITKNWSDRPSEIANLLNPAFCALLVRELVVGYQKERGSGMPFSLLFVTMPIVLHKETRELLPRSIRTKLHVWLQNNPSVRIGFSLRARNLAPYIKESVMFGIRYGMVEMTGEGDLVAPKFKKKMKNWDKASEPHFCKKASYYIGRWFAGGGEVATIYAMWGVRP